MRITVLPLEVGILSPEQGVTTENLVPAGDEEDLSWAWWMPYFG